MFTLKCEKCKAETIFIQEYEGKFPRIKRTNKDVIITSNISDQNIIKCNKCDNEITGG